MKKIISMFAMTTVLLYCASKPERKELTYKNIVILSDLSSRIVNKPCKDEGEIHQIVNYFITECVKPGQKIGDRSSISFSAFSSKIITGVDLEKFKNLGEKQQFINSTGKYENSGLKRSIREFEKTINITYKNKRDEGLDLISVLIEKIENEPIIKKNTFLTNGTDTTYLKYDNHIYIFTDGYLEYKGKALNSQYYFGIPEIDKIRRFCKINKVSAKVALQKNQSLGIPAIRSSKNRLVTQHIYETHERDKNERLQTYLNPKGLRDNEILEAVWKKWAFDSGFKNLEWKKY